MPSTGKLKGQWTLINVWRPLYRLFTDLGCKTWDVTCFFFKNGPSPASISFIFELFQTNNTIFTTIQCEQMSCPSSIRRRESNPRPLECESPPMTTRPGLPPMRRHMCCRAKKTYQCPFANSWRGPIIKLILILSPGNCLYYFSII